MHEDASPTVAEDHLDLVVGELLDDEPDVEHRMMDDVAILVGVADRVGAAVVEIGVGRAGHRVVPRHPLGCRLLRRPVGALLRPVPTRLAEGMNLAADDALDAPDLILVHADDGVRCVCLAAR